MFTLQAPILIQLPMWITLSFALRHLCRDAPPASLKEEGFSIWQDLTQLDTTKSIAVIMGLTHLLNLEVDHAMFSR